MSEKIISFLLNLIIALVGFALIQAYQAHNGIVFGPAEIIIITQLNLLILLATGAIEYVPSPSKQKPSSKTNS